MMENVFCIRSWVTLSIVSYTFILGRPSPLLLFSPATHKLCTNILLQGLTVQHYSSMYLSIASRWRLQEAHNFSLERGKVLDALKNATIFPMLDWSFSYRAALLPTSCTERFAMKDDERNYLETNYGYYQ